MHPAKRAKRDTAENLYKTCRLGGDCIPDVVNKVENKTLADILLQAFSSILFLGNLGIGSGKGTGGVTGIRPGIPETIAPNARPGVPTVTRPSVTRPTRPFSVPIDSIGVSGRPSLGTRPVDPTGLRPIDVIDPTSPAIVTLSETSPDTVITLGEPGVTTGDVGQRPDLTVTTDTTSIQSHPTVITQTNTDVAIINVSAADAAPTRVIYSTSSFINPSFSVESVIGHIDPDLNIFVDPLRTGETIDFGEEIPLQPINPIQEFDLEDIPKTSTPSEAVGRAVSRARQWYNRYTQQQPTRNVDFLGNVSRAITFGFENPAFEPEVTLQFEQDLNDVAAAPDIDFAGIRSISRPYYSTTPKGTVRVSRLGQRTGVTTRRGTVFGQPVHYYYDISAIEEIELPTLTQSSTSGLIEMDTETTFLDSSGFEYPELLDNYEETFDRAQLLLDYTAEEGERENIPVVTAINNIKPYVVSYDKGFVISPSTSINIAKIVPGTVGPVLPIQYIIGYSDDFLLDPSLLKRRKRKRSEIF
uniref:Minor capsid protein L2 n=1 Tax=Human papillomavirus TaxID=10566 RepID=A0A451G3D7_9PAPI|nr:MAG: L2 protein [Human papillomavirus]